MSEAEHLALKAALLALIFAVGAGGGAVAFAAGRGAGGDRLLALGGAFAAGVFLGAGVIHLLPDSVEALGQSLAGVDFPLAYLLATLGFAAILFVERVALAGAHGAGVADAAAPYALVVVLSLHSVLAGAALGAEGTLAGSLVVFFAIVAHKGAAGFALVVDGRRGGLAHGRVVRLLLVFAAMTPLGIVAGAAADRLVEARGERLFEGVFDGLAAGTFLYVAILEIVAKEFAAPAAQAAKFALLAAGLALMALIAVWL